MGATPMANRGDEEAGLLERWSRGAALPRRPEAAAWDCVAHPSLMPTVFARSESAPALTPWREVVARKV